MQNNYCLTKPIVNLKTIRLDDLPEPCYNVDNYDTLHLYVMENVKFLAFCMLNVAQVLIQNNAHNML